MPFALIARLLTRALVVLGVVVLRRRMRSGTGRVPPSYRTPGTGAPGAETAGAEDPVASGSPRSARAPDWRSALAGGTWLGRKMPDVLAGARLAGFALSFAAFGSAALVLLSAGTTLATLGPRWVGAVMLGLAAMFGLAATREAIWLRRAVVLRRRRRSLQER